MAAPVMYHCGAVGEVRLFTGNSGNFVTATSLIPISSITI